MLHAHAVAGSTSWIVSLANDREELCVLRICTNELEAKEYVSQINSCVIPQQRKVIDKLECLQNILKSILEKTGTNPKTSDEFVIAVRKAIRYIEVGKSTNEN